jgi:two-component system sensor kinase FixL
MKIDDDHAVRATLVAGRAWVGAGLVPLVAALAISLWHHSLFGSLHAMALASLLVLSTGLIAFGYRRISAGPGIGPATAQGGNRFRLSRIPFWEQDWSPIRRRLAGMSPRSDFATSDNSEIGEFASTIRTIAANGAAIAFTEHVLPDEAASRYLPPFNDTVVIAAVRAYLHGEVGFETETELETVNGEAICVVVSFEFPDDPTGDVGVLMSAVDISPYKFSLPDRFDEGASGRTAIDADAMGILTTAIVDELCEHLSTVQISAESTVRWLGRADPDLMEVRKSIRNVLLANDRSAIIIRLARDFLRKSGTSLESISLAALIDETALLMANELSAAGIDHELLIADDLPEITADRAAMQQLLMQLLAVAIEALKVEETLERRLTILANRHHDDEVIVAIEDNAGSIGPERLDPAAFPSTGIVSVERRRLAACRETVVAHGGKLRILRRPGLGSVISFTFPANGIGVVKGDEEAPPSIEEYITLRDEMSPLRSAPHTKRY